MAWGVLQYPGTEHGVCEGECKHNDCALTREQAATICPGCDQAIGYGRAFTNYNGPWHLSCMRFFRSRIASQTVYGGRYFITSEQFEDSRGNRAARLYTVREITDDGDVRTAEGFKFQQFDSLRAAKNALLESRCAGCGHMPQTCVCVAVE